MRFALRMALRELRRSRRKFVFFLLCIAIGVAGLVGVKGFNASLQHGLLREARTLMAADMQVSLGKPASEAQQALLHELESEKIQVIHITETASMAVNPANRETQLVEVKAVEPGYPFYGVLEQNPRGELTADTVLVGDELLDRLALKAGDSLKVGAATFTIAGVITKEPDRVTAGFGMGPRVMLTQAGLTRANLIQLGSRASHKYLLKLADDRQVEATRERLKVAFAPDRGRIADFREAQPQIKRFLDRMTSFLALVSMVALLVGGLGVANATRVFIQQKLDTIAVMKCLGATNRKVAMAYLTQMVLLGAAGSLLGITLGYTIQLVMPRVVGSLFDVTLDQTLSPEVALQGLAVGLLTSLLFTLLPLTQISEVKPALVFRREMAEQRHRPSWGQRARETGLYAAVGLGLAFIAAWVSGRLDWGFYFMGGLIGAVLALGAASFGAVRAVKAIRPPRAWVVVRQGLANLHRPGSQTDSIVLALGIGVTMVLAIYLLQRGLMNEVRLTSPAGSPNIFFLGLQTPDAANFQEFVKRQPGVAEAPAPIPIVRGRLIRVDGKTRNELTLTQEEERWFNFSFSLTFSEPVPPGSEIVKGSWWTAESRQGRTLVSVEQEAATRLHLDVGSTVEMELEGAIALKAEVSNIRRTTDFRAGGAFNFVFEPSVLKDIPVTYLAQARVDPAAAQSLQKEAVARFPGLTIINLNEVLETVGSVMDRIGLVIRFVAGFSVAAGLIILASSIAATKFRRTREAVLFKTLGATRSRVWRIFAMEYAALGLVAGLVGAGLSAVAAWSVLTYVMEIKYKLEVLPLLAGVGITVALTVAVGVLSTLDVLREKPLQVLREE